jgi:hypothetical protein
VVTSTRVPGAGR